MNWNMFYLLAPEADKIISGSGDFCQKLRPVWTIFGYIIFAIQIIVPLLLIISGMITMAKAVMEKDEKEIKKAQNLLVKKLIAAVIAFLVIAVVKLVVGLLSDGQGWQDCAECALKPFSGNGCGIVSEPGDYQTSGSGENKENEGTTSAGGMIYVPGLFE